MQNALAKGERYLVQRHGETIAVVVPVEMYKQWQKSRERFLRRCALRKPMLT